MKILTAKDILATPNKVTQKELPSAGGLVNIRRLSPAGNERLAEFYIRHTSEGMIKYSRVDFQALIMSLVVVDADGETPIFTDEDMAALRKKDADLWNDLWDAVEEVNPLGTKKQVEEAKKN